MKSALLSTLLFAVSLVSGHDWNTTCTTKSPRRSWTSLSDTEKAEYIAAALCVQATAAQAGIDGAQNRWDKLHWSHISQTSLIHGVGYLGTASVVLDPETGFGGGGSKSCVTDGPFVDLKLHFNATSPTNEYCLYRSLSIRDFSSAAQSNVDKCMETTTYEDVASCLENGGPHSAGHGGVGGLMVNVALSPADPLFYLHHAYLDKFWWEWQELDLEARLVDMGGRNQPGGGGGGGGGGPPALLADNGDPGNVTTLNHILGMVNIVPDAIIAEVMDVRGDVVCAEYL